MKSKTEEENGRWYPLRVKLKRDTEEVIYNIKRDFEIQTQRIPPTKKKKESARNELEGCYYPKHRNLYL